MVLRTLLVALMALKMIMEDDDGTECDGTADDDCTADDGGGGTGDGDDDGTADAAGDGYGDGYGK